MKAKLEEFFSKQIRPVNFNWMIKAFNLKSEEMVSFVNALYELETEGKIEKVDENTYRHVPLEYIYSVGKLEKSNKGNLVVDLGHGDVAFVKNSDTNLNEGDYIWFIKHQDDAFKHKYILDDIKKITKIELYNNYLITAEIKKDYNNNTFYIMYDNRKIGIAAPDLCGAYPGDKVTLRIMMDNLGHERVIVKSILERKSNTHIFRVITDDKAVSIGTLGVFVDVPEGKNINIGDFLQYELVNEEYNFVSKIDKLDQNIIAHAKEMGFETEFSENTLKEAREIDTNISDEEINRRVDLRNLVTFTIDSETAKDLDDAVSIEKDGDDYILYVSIADVSFYVKDGTSLFETAVNRTTSIYPANMVIPMLPEELSNGICSLNQNEDKLTKTVKIKISPSGRILEYDIFNSVINSNLKMSYTKVNRFIEGLEYDPKYIPFKNQIIEMCRLSHILDERRMKRGFLCFDTNEYEYDIDDDGNVIGLSERVRGPGQIMIENFMLIANEIVAGYINSYKFEGSFRNHECPDEKQIEKITIKYPDLRKYVRSLKSIDNPRTFQKILLSMFSGKKEEEINYLSKIFLKAMNRAFYSTYCEGHYGLALDEYATFTSPIRRLPDLLNHMVVGAILDGRTDIDSITEKFEEYSIHASEKQVDADQFEENINSILLNRYFANYAGEEIDARVKFINKDFICIRTSFGMVGIIPINKYAYNNGKVTINGEHVNLDDNIVVMYDYVNEFNGDVTFKYIRNNRKNRSR